MESQALVSYIEKIRYGRNISQEQMLNGIISIRQYRRYLYGEVEIPFGVFAQLAAKINVSPKNLILQFEEEKNKEKRLIVSYYNAVISYDDAEVQELYKTIDHENIIDSDLFVFFKSANAIYRYNKKELTKAEVAEILKDLIGYPAVLSNKILTDTEMYLLGNISQYDVSTKTLIMDKLQLLFEDDKLVVSGDNVVTFVQILFWLAKYNGSLKNFDKTIEYCDKGIKYNQQFHSKYAMNYFYYYKALALYRTNNIKEFKMALYYAILYLELETSQSKTEHFYAIIRKDFDIEPLTFIKDYIEKVKEK